MQLGLHDNQTDKREYSTTMSEAPNCMSRF
jgi:hypothetical protein